MDVTDVRPVWSRGNASSKSRLLLFTVASMAALGSLSCPGRASRGQTHLDDYNLIIIVIDALRADHLGCYGYTRKTSPFIDSLADEGVVFDRAMSNSSYTRETIAVLLSGLLPSRSGGVGWLAHPPVGTVNLGQFYRNSGYRTGFFSNTPMLKDRRFTRGFDEVTFIGRSSRMSQHGPSLSNRALAFANACRGRKFMMYLHYLDPHAPYNPPEEFYLRYADTVFPYPLELYGEVRQKCPQLIRNGFGPGEPRFDDLVLRYDAEIAHTDYSIAMLFRGLDRLKVLDKTLVLVTADHGEEFLEHAFVEHAWTLYNESLRVPLIFWAPGVLTAQRNSSLVSTVDLLPTLLDLMGIRHGRRDLDGAPLFQRRGNDWVVVAPPEPFISELLIQHRSLLRAVIQDGWKYVAAQKWLEPGSRAEVARNMARLVRMYRNHPEKRLDIWGPVVHEELFNLAEDPQERRNLLESAPDRLAELRAVLEALRTRCGRQAEQVPTRDEEEEILSPEEIEKLRSLGYL